MWSVQCIISVVIANLFKFCENLLSSNFLVYHSFLLLMSKQVATNEDYWVYKAVDREQFSVETIVANIAL